ncbi:MAG: MopE-related protein [Myxococcota bacterium]|nr:MopE-related protein [Myxococcota bacterium]
MRSAPLLALPGLLALLVACDTGGPVNTTTTDDTGDAGIPNIAVSVTSVDFGIAADVGISERAQITVSNTGTGVLEITDFAVDGPFSSGTTVLTLQPQSSQNVSLTYRPVDYDEARTTLLIQSNDPDTPDMGVALIGAVETDVDGDGHDRPEAGGDDCDDSNAAVYPGAEEIWYDGIDQDCAGDNDFDKDGDGYTAEPYGGDDCIDANAAVHPGAEDIWYDNIDSNCDGADDFDQDGDGYSIKSTKSKDCDDTNPSVYPGAIEYLDGIKNDCEGQTDQDMSVDSADISVVGNASGDSFGSSVEMGDLDGDGLVDIVVGAQGDDSGNGVVYIWTGAGGLPTDGAPVGTSDVEINGSSTEGLGSNIVMLGDFGGDEGNDIGIGASLYSYSSYMYKGRIFIADAATLADGGDTSDAHTVVTGYTYYYYYDYSFSSVGEGFNSGDLNGDGVQDLLFWSNIGGYSASYYEDRYAVIYGEAGGLGNFAAEDADASYITESYSSNIAHSINGGIDVDGDGIDDWIMGGQGVDNSYTNAGRAWMWWGSSTEYSTSSDTLDATDYFSDYWGGDEASAAVGASAHLVEDMDGDGLGEVTYFNGDTGALGFTFGSASLKGAGGMSFDDDTDLFIELGSSYAPSHVNYTADVTGDGNPELVIVANASGSDAAWVFDVVGASGDLTKDDALFSFANTASDHNTGDFGAGFSSTPQDFDGDGVLDLVFGDPAFGSDLDGDGEADDDVGGLFVWNLY